jgi:hypothetical protein
VAQPHIYRRFAWPAWDRWHWVARLDWFRRRRDARDAAPLLRGRRGTWWHPPGFHVAGVAQPRLARRVAWQAWDRWHWAACLDWFRRRRGSRASFLPSPTPLQPLKLIIGRSWLVGLSGPLIFIFCLIWIISNIF